MFLKHEKKQKAISLQMCFHVLLHRKLFHKNTDQPFLKISIYNLTNLETAQVQDDNKRDPLQCMF